MKQMVREKIVSRDMTIEEAEAMQEVKFLMGFVNSETYDKVNQDEFVQAIVGCGAAHAMKDKYILTAAESAVLIAALRKLTGRKLQ